VWLFLALKPSQSFAAQEPGFPTSTLMNFAPPALASDPLEMVFESGVANGGKRNVILMVPGS
jgi:hypothetical protein